MFAGDSLAPLFKFWIHIQIVYYGNMDPLVEMDNVQTQNTKLYKFKLKELPNCGATFNADLTIDHTKRSKT